MLEGEASKAGSGVFHSPEKNTVKKEIVSTYG